MMVRLALKIFCSNLQVGNPGVLKTCGPLLLVSNHPNSFLDAIIIGSQFKETVHFLARGDAFNKPRHGKLLRLLNMIPIYRLSEGRENLFMNEAAFICSKEILSQNGIVLIFIEGACVHKHELQPFKKGAARIALESKELNGFRVLPIGIAYDSFEKFGKQINIRPGNILEVNALLPYEDAGLNFRYFNTIMFDEISKKIAIPQAERSRKVSSFTPLSMAGIVLHAPLYFFLKNTIRKKTQGTVFYDSVLFGVLLFLYPLYLLLLFILLRSAGVPVLINGLIIFLHPITAWCSVHKPYLRG